MVDIRWARADERAEVAAFMQRVFPRAKWPPSYWRRLLDGRWSRPGDSYAILARDGAALVGVLGLVLTERPTEGGMAVTANMSSWYILADYRGQGLGSRMIALAHAVPGVTITDLTSSPRAVTTIRRAGLEPLDDTRLLWHPRRNAARLKVHTPAAVWSRLSSQDRRILSDLNGLPQAKVVVETADGLLLVVRSIKRKHESHLTHEVLHLGNRSLFAAHARVVADSVLPEAGAALSVDRRFAPDVISADAEEAIPVPRFWTPGRMQAADVDHLYSEVVLMDMKLD